MRNCIVHGCKETLTRPDHEMCLPHWRAGRDGRLEECPDCGTVYEGGAPHCPKCGPNRAAREELLSSTKIGKQFDLSAPRVNLVLAELGWIVKGPSDKGWVPSPQGTRRDGILRHATQTGIPYVVWPASILDDKALLTALAELRAPAASEGVSVAEQDRAYGANRPEQPGALRAQDGHLVRSRGELLIDNWLYQSGIVHAYERRLPIAEEAYCDFWVASKVYIEYWGMDGADYERRRKEKLALYAKYKLELIEITNEDIDRLDDVLPPRLLRHGISSK